MKSGSILPKVLAGLVITAALIFFNGGGVLAADHSVGDLNTFKSTINSLSDGDTINLTGTITLDNNVTIDKQVTITSTSADAVTVNSSVYSVIVAAGGDVTLAENVTVSGSVYSPGSINVGVIHVENAGKFTLAGGHVEANEEGAPFLVRNGIYSEGTVNIDGGTVEAGYIGVQSGHDGTLNITNGTIQSNNRGISASYSSVNISGGRIEGYHSVDITRSDVTISGGSIEGRQSSVDISNSDVTISGGNFIVPPAPLIVTTAVVVKGASTVTISGTTNIYGDYSISIENYSNNGNVPTVNIEVSPELSITGHIMAQGGGTYTLLQTLPPAGIEMMPGETYELSFWGMNSSSLTANNSDPALNASISPDDWQTVILQPAPSTPPGPYDLKLTMTCSDPNGQIANLNLTIPVTVTASVTLAVIPGVTPPVRGATAVSAITETEQYTGTVSWSPALADGKFAAGTVYTATITLTPKTGYTLTGIGANFFTVAGANPVTNDAGSGIVTAAFPKTRSGGGDDGSGSPSNTGNLPAANTNTNIVESASMDKQTTTTPAGQTMETFTVKAGASAQIEAAKGAGQTTVQFKVDSAQTSITNVNVPNTVLQSASDLNVSITTPNATLELPSALVNALAQAGKSLDLTITRGNPVATPAGTTPLGAPTIISTDIAGPTKVNLPLDEIAIPADAEEKADFLAGLAVFVLHSDGEQEIIKGEIIYDDGGNPVNLVFPVDKFSTFAIVKLDKKTIILTIDRNEALVNGTPYNLDASPYLDTNSDRNLVPLRFISETLGAAVEWVPAARQVRIEDGTKEIILTLDSTEVVIDGAKTQTDCAPVIIPPGRTFLPLRFISENLGAEVKYDEASRQITVVREYKPE